MDGESAVFSIASNDKVLSPGRMRTMKEYEEQMAELKKENFNLKLRIYFTEERQEQMKGIKNMEELFNKNLELSNELDSLRKDLSEKEELLIQSARAVKILQHEHQDKVEEIKSELEKENSYLEDHIANLQKALKEKDKKLGQLDKLLGYSRLEERDQAVLGAELNNMTRKVVKLEEELEVEKEKFLTLQQELECSTEENIRLKDQLRTLETELEKREAHLQQAYIDLGRKVNLPQLTVKPPEQKDERLTQKEERDELVKMINDMEKKFEMSVNNKKSGHSLSHSSSSNNSLSANSTEQPASNPSIFRQIFFSGNK